MRMLVRCSMLAGDSIDSLSMPLNKISPNLPVKNNWSTAQWMTQMMHSTLPSRPSTLASRPSTFATNQPTSFLLPSLSTWSHKDRNLSCRAFKD